MGRGLRGRARGLCARPTRDGTRRGQGCRRDNLMAFGRLERSASAQPMSDINMTPLIDVMLVLLVIFMITAPLMTSSLKLDLPKAEGAKPTDAPQFVTLAIDPQGRFFWGDEAVSIETLRLRVREAALRN